MKRWFVMVALGLGMTDAASAQTRDTVRLEELTVTATREPVAREATTTSLTVITGDELRARGILTVAEALQRVPNAAVVPTGGFGGTTSLFLRGGESDYVQVLIDGVPVNEPGGAYDFAYLTTVNVERIEVLRGPGSVTYGSDGVSGVINILTRRGMGPMSVQGSVRGGSYGSVAADAAVSGSTESVDFAFGAQRFRSGGVYQFNNDFDNTVVSGRVGVRPDESTDIAVHLRYRDSRYAYPTDGSGAVVDRNAAQLSEATTVGLEVARQVTDRLRARLTVGSNVTATGTDDPQDDPADTVGFYAYHSLQDMSRQRADLRLGFDAGGGISLSAGAEAEQQEERGFNESMSEFGPSFDSGDHERSNVGYYAQGLLVRNRLSLLAGIRMDDNEAFGTFATYRLGASLLLPAGTRVRSNIGRGFKAPTFYENYASGFVTGNPALRPERTRSWEVGLEQRLLADRVWIAGTYFNQRFRDLIQFTFAEAPNYQNVAEADASGIEVELEAVAMPGVRLRGSLSYLDTEVIDAGYDTGAEATFVAGQRLLRRPTTTWQAGVEVTALKPLLASLDLRHVGGRDDRDFSTVPATPVVLDAVTTLDLASEMPVWSDAAGATLVATLSVTNALDARYETVVGFPARGRVVMAGIRVER